MNGQDPFDDTANGAALPRRIALGTMHGKETALVPAFARLGVDLVVAPGVDTDRFGSFDGMTPRAGTMEEAARAKARAAMAATGLTSGLASEGAYGPHPAIPWLAAGIEILLWRNDATGQEVVERLIDDSPAYDRVEVAADADLAAFLGRAGFPETALVVAPAVPPGAPAAPPTAKGLRDRAALDQALAAARRSGDQGRAVVQTDMRAHMNPRRMQTIARLGARLADRLACRCASCGAPGWGRIGTEPGLPCADCGGPSLLVARELHGCTACGATRSQPRADGLTTADPGQCPFCNP